MAGTGDPPWTRWMVPFVAGVVVGIAVFAGTVAGFGYTFSPGSVGQVTFGAIYVNYTYASPVPVNDSQPLHEFFQNLPRGGAPGTQLGITMSPYDNSSVNCTLWSLAVLAPYSLVSVTVTALPYPSNPVSQPLPVTLTAAIHGVSEWANLDVVILLPDHAGTLDLSILGTATC